jgi:thymidine kinase
MLHFYYGVMGSSKTAQLLMQRYNYQQLGLKVALVKPAVDTRAGQNVVFSRVGLQADAELVLGPNHSIRELLWLAAQRAHSDFQYLFIDEAQFLSEAQVQELAELSDSLDIFCYGLKTDFRGQFFPGSVSLRFPP